MRNNTLHTTARGRISVISETYGVILQSFGTVAYTGMHFSYGWLPTLRNDCYAQVRSVTAADTSYSSKAFTPTRFVCIAFVDATDTRRENSYLMK